MSNSPEGSPLRDSYPQSGNKVEGYNEEFSYQDHHLKQNQQQQPFPTGIFPEQFHPKDISQHTPLKVPLQTSANWVSPKHVDYYSIPQQQLLSAPQHPSSPNNNYPLPSSQCSDQEPDHHSTGVPSGNVSYEEFILAEERKSSSSIDPKTALPKSWPKVLPPPPAKVASPPRNVSYEEFIAAEDKQISSSTDPKTGFPKSWPKVSPSPPAKKASPSNVPQSFPPPSPPPPPPPRSCSCCTIL